MTNITPTVELLIMASVVTAPLSLGPANNGIMLDYWQFDKATYQPGFRWPSWPRERVPREAERVQACVAARRSPIDRLVAVDESRMSYAPFVRLYA